MRYSNKTIVNSVSSVLKTAIKYPIMTRKIN
jgi:hypothetical protein